MKFNITGTLWYSDEAEYSEFRNACSDPEKMYPTYSEWLSQTQQQIDEFVKQGAATVKVKADAREFIRWCTINARDPDQASRSAFASTKAKEQTGIG